MDALNVFRLSANGLIDMKKKLSKISCLWAISALMILAGAVYLTVRPNANAAALVTEIKDVRFLKAAAPGNGEKIHVLLSGKNIPKVAVLEGDRPRIVIDFANTRLAGSKKPAIDAGGYYVKRIRIGVHKNQMIRVVLDLEAGLGYIADQSFDHSANIYEIQVRPDKPVRVDNKIQPEKPIPAGRNFH